VNTPITAKIGKTVRQNPKIKKAPSPHWLWPARAWLLHLEQSLSVNRETTSTPYQDILKTLQGYSGPELQSLVTQFFERPAGSIHYALMRPMRDFPALGNDISKSPVMIRLVMYHHALSGQGGNVCTFTLNFSEKYINRVAARSCSGDSFSSILNDKLKYELKNMFKDNGLATPEFFFVVEQPRPDCRGPHGGVLKGKDRLHLHGEINADSLTLPLVKEALTAASAGFRKQGSVAVKFGEPLSYIGERAWPPSKCLSNFPNADRAARSRYSSHWAEHYCLKDIEFTQAQANRFGFELGSPWKVSSPLVTQEANACLRLLNLLIQHIPAGFESSAA